MNMNLLLDQVFSNSVASGLRFYQKHVPKWKDCEATISFCKWMNDMFDALNRRHPIDGVRVGNRDYRVCVKELILLMANSLLDSKTELF